MRCASGTTLRNMQTDNEGGTVGAYDDVTEVVYTRTRRPLTDEELEGYRETLREVEPQLRRSIRWLREEMGWSQSRLAAELARLGLHVDPTAVTRMETGDRKIRPDELWALAVVLRVELGALICFATVDADPAVLLPLERERLQNLQSQLERHMTLLDDQRRRVEALEQQAGGRS